jgi:type II secretory pathway component PulJ
MYLRAEPTGRRASTRRGFTITEMVIAAFLSAFLALLLAAAVATFARPAAEVDGRTRLALEASLAAEALARDLGGFLADNSGNPGTLIQYKFASWSFSSDGTTLFLNFQGTTPGPPYVIVTYQQQGYQLVRTQLTSGTQTVVASHVTKFFVQPDPNNANNAQIQLTLTYPDPSGPRNPFPSFSGTYVFIGVPPPP